MIKTIFITGAGSGIGEATANLFYRKGWIVGAYDINKKAVNDLKDKLGNRCLSGYIDVTDLESVKAAFTHFSKCTNGRLDALCNNAGVFDDILFEHQSYESIDRIVRVNVDGVVNCAKEAFPMLKATKGAKLVNVASGASVYGVPNEAVYSASKFFVRGFSEALELEWKGNDIGIAIIMPAYVDTPMVHNAEISWGDKFGVNLKAQDVAKSIWKSCHRKKLYWPMPLSVRMLMMLVRGTPLALLPKVARKIFY